MHRRTVLAVTLATLVASSANAFAQAFPNRPMNMIVPFAAGGPTDTLARIVAEKMGQILGQAITIENVGGAGGMTGSSRVAKSAPDGYTLVMGTVGTHAQGQTLYAKPAYNAVDDFTPVALIAEIPLTLTTRKDLPANNLQEFIAYAKANQKTMTFAHSGAGAAVHLGCVTFNLAIGVEVTPVAFRGSAPAFNDILGGRIDYICEVLSGASAHYKGGTVKVLAVMHEKRSPALPDVPTADEQGLKGFSAYTWNAIFLPKGAPADVVDKLNKAAVAAYNDPAIRKRLEDIGYSVSTPERASPQFLGDFVKAEIAKWATPIKAANIKIE